eukprot:632357-Hanusia_phi.AAC.4
MAAGVGQHKYHSALSLEIALKLMEGGEGVPERGEMGGKRRVRGARGRGREGGVRGGEERSTGRR